MVTHQSADVCKILIIGLYDVNKVIERCKKQPFILSSSPIKDNRQQAGESDKQKKQRRCDDMLVFKHFFIYP